MYFHVSASIDPKVNIYLWGGPGTGKTIVALEIVKTKLSLFKAENKPVKVIVTSANRTEETPLLENMKNQLRNIEEVSVLPLKQFCENIAIDYDLKHPKDMINKIIRSLSTDSDHHHLFVCDEVFACHSDGQETADWSDLATAENVTWVLAIKPTNAYSDDNNNLTPPSDSDSIISRKLLHSHRNSYQIRSVSIGLFYISYQ